MLKRFICFLSIFSLIIVNTLTSYAGWLQLQGTSTWYYAEGNILVANGWKAINGQWYYFGPDGHMYANTYTPDGYYVNNDGVWVNNNQSNVQYATSGSSNTTASKYLYKSSPSLNSCSLVTANTTINGTSYKNFYKFSKGGSLIVVAPNKYTTLTFKYLVKTPNEDNEYNLQIYVNGVLQDEIDEVKSSLQTYSVDFEVGQTIKLVWNSTTDGSSSLAATQLYLMEGAFSK